MVLEKRKSNIFFLLFHFNTIIRSSLIIFFRDINYLYERNFISNEE
jgi:hypothetical protein